MHLFDIKKGITVNFRRFVFPYEKDSTLMQLKKNPLLKQD